MSSYRDTHAPTEGAREAAGRARRTEPAAKRLLVVIVALAVIIAIVLLAM